MKVKFQSWVPLILVMVSSCSENTGPALPDVTPSTLTLAFSGDSTKVGTIRRFDDVSLSSPGHSIDGTRGACEVTASWTICPESSFRSYTLYRSENRDIASSPASAVVLGIFTDPDSTGFVDDEIEWATGYHYALKTTDLGDNSVWSNEDSIMTPGSIPTPSVLALDEITQYYVYLTWSMCPDSDFESYSLYRSDVPDIQSDTSLAQRIRRTTLVSSTSFIDDDLEEGATYYYALMTESTKSLVSWSNELQVNLFEGFPDSVSATVAVGHQPQGLCSLPSGDYLYVAHRNDDEISIIRTADNVVTATVDLGHSSYGVCSLPSGEYVYAACYNEDEVAVISTVDNTIAARIAVGNGPNSICSLPSGDYVYVANRYDATVSVIQTLDNAVVATVPVGLHPTGICSLPFGDYVYVALNGTDEVSVIQTSDNTVVASINVGNSPEAICSLPSGDYVYVTNCGDDNVSVIRTSDNEVVASVDVGEHPGGICSTPSGEYVYVTSKNDPLNHLSDVISIINTSYNSVIMNVLVGPSPIGICCLPSGNSVYAAHVYDDYITVIQ